MSEKLVRIYNALNSAEEARKALLASGFSREKLHLSSMADEAGPVEGNFILEYKDAAHDNDTSFLDSLFQRDDPNEGLGRQAVAWSGTCILTVDVDDEVQLRQAGEIISQFGGVNANER